MQGTKGKCVATVAVGAMVMLAVILSVTREDPEGGGGGDGGDFRAFVDKHGKAYEEEEFAWRQKVYEGNLEFVRRFNERSEGVELGENWMADFTDEEYRELLIEPDSSPPHPPPSYLPITSLPTALNWFQLGAVTPVKDQKSCGSCYAFASAAAIESAYYLNSSRLISLSEQELVDCSKPYGNRGCNGGKLYASYRYASIHGLMLESDYPYTKYAHEECFAVEAAPRVYISDYALVPKYDQMQLKIAVAGRPVAVALQADQKIFQLYKSGVVGMECGSRLSHAALLVGYGTASDGTPYWLIKNSWGTGWGEHGFIRLLRTDEGKDAGPCGVTLDATYPVI